LLQRGLRLAIPVATYSPGMTDRIALDLPDGRVLDVQVSGPADGTLFIWHHGTPGCLYQEVEKQRVLHSRRLRYASYSRAGVAGSTRKKGRAVADVAADMAAIADHLGADTFLTGGQSGGGPHALATGAGLPDRVLAVLAVCAVKPYVGQPDFLDGMGADNVEEFNLALQGEDALLPFLEEQRTAILEADAEGVIRALDSLLPDVDRAVLTGEVGEDTIRNLQGGAEELYGWLDDDLAFTRDWGFALDSLQVPTYVWQGSVDLMVPFHHGEWLAANIPGAVAHLEPGEGHLSIQVAKFEEMLDELLPHVRR
jgi:pimeloyl-ACP methyl ester carboxylesterase